ncbi:glycine-rich RNA-binding protein 4, mitochondrial [Phalaenopsis equestris]|uniref:glycine-rich RNA-binding protein 4, mitochondrial n=1 Tax=Phalaenopsis equestris TaxID=78828 RepID=UPI0009E21383|nr:glycine-rich RNA-binding protein 4, mitochondrial [Phalaenopsis equestris]
MAAALLPVAIPTSSLYSRKQSVACASSSFEFLHKRRFSIRSLTFPPSSSQWSAVVFRLPRGGSVVVACSSSSSPKNTPRPSTRLFVSGLSFRTTEESLRGAFQNFGELLEVNLVMDRIANRPRGFAFLRYATEEESKKAIEGMHGKFLDGRVIFVEVAKPRAELRQNSKPASRPLY